MIEIRYYANEIELLGTLRELNEIREAIEKVDGDISHDIRFPADTDIDASPYNSVGKILIVRTSSGPTKVSVEDGFRILVEGSGENLRAFASFFSFDETVSGGDHSHYEFYEGDNNIAPDSTSLVIAVKDN